MRHANTISVSLILLGTSLCAAPAARPQNDQTSVAEAARKARAQKKSEKPVPVTTNDTLEPPKAGKPEITTPTATEPTMPGATASVQASGNSSTATTEEKPTTEAKAADAEKDPEAKKELEALKLQIRDIKREVDLAQRALSLANEDFYSKPDFSNNTEGKAKLDAMMNELAQKKDELTQLLAKLPTGESADEPKAAQPQQP